MLMTMLMTSDGHYYPSCSEEQRRCQTVCGMFKGKEGSLLLDIFRLPETQLNEHMTAVNELNKGAKLLRLTRCLLILLSKSSVPGRNYPK
ncbi:unnamed protein product [Peronospora belbahrii]|uniref:Uncharacterized protein n=1 Tax=Peronospora belbahrii TaxID=622444 RepID=A0AAU9KWX5_9STRA|nr:unnamed protein product [Peronospora belbahrii]CAH0478294.1 unnamed protein product [Peronospora belbahrii]CAH0514307.1 unnamed protein product [Peronospora belbahrii]CAH0514308.1 unnamed protein product [Peronospora belbahrii]